MSIGSFIAGQTRKLVSLAINIHVLGLKQAVASGKRTSAEHFEKRNVATQARIAADQFAKVANDAEVAAFYAASFAAKTASLIEKAAAAEAKKLGRTL